MQTLDLVRVEVRAILVHVGVVREERGLRDSIRVRDAITSVPGLRDVGGVAILAGDTQTDDLYRIRVSLGTQWRRGGVPHLAGLEVATVRVDPGIHSRELVAMGYQKRAVKSPMLAVSAIQGLRGDVVLGRDDVASIVCNNGRAAVAVGGEGGLGYARLRNKHEGTTSQHYAPWRTAVAASTKVARRPDMSGEKSVFEDVRDSRTGPGSSEKCDGFYTLLHPGKNPGVSPRLLFCSRRRTR